MQQDFNNSLIFKEKINVYNRTNIKCYNSDPLYVFKYITNKLHQRVKLISKIRLSKLNVVLQYNIGFNSEILKDL